MIEPAAVSSVIMNLRNRNKTASISNIWTPRSRAAKLQNTVKTTELEATTPLPRFLAQRIAPHQPFASLEDFSVELATTESTVESESTTATAQTETDNPISLPATARTTSLWQLVSKLDKCSDKLVHEKPSELPNVDAVVTTEYTPKDSSNVDDENIDLMEAIDELPDIESSSLEMLMSDGDMDDLDDLSEQKSTKSINLADPFRSTEYAGSLKDNHSDDDDDALLKSKRAIGNEKLLPLGEIVRPAQKMANKKQTLAERLQNETSGERAERLQKNIQRLMHFVTIVGHVDSYLSKRFRTGVKKMAQLYDSTEHAHLRRPAAASPHRHRRRIRFGVV